MAQDGWGKTLQVQLWIDKNGRNHYHLDNCPMLKSVAINVATHNFIESHYEPIKRRVKFNYRVVYPNFIVVDKKIYYPCPMCKF